MRKGDVLDLLMSTPAMMEGPLQGPHHPLQGPLWRKAARKAPQQQQRGGGGGEANGDGNTSMLTSPVSPNGQVLPLPPPPLPSSPLPSPPRRTPCARSSCACACACEAGRWLCEVVAWWRGGVFG
jgi:hypothetical protein